MLKQSYVLATDDFEACVKGSALLMPLISCQQFHPPLRCCPFPSIITFDFSESQLVLLEMWLPSSLAGPHRCNTSSWYSLWSSFTRSLCMWETVCLLKSSLAGTAFFVAHAIMLYGAQIKMLFITVHFQKQRLSCATQQTEFSKQRGCGSKDWVSQLHLHWESKKSNILEMRAWLMTIKWPIQMATAPGCQERLIWPLWYLTDNLSRM